MRIGIPKETRAGQTLVAATPNTVKKLIALGYEVAIERGAGELASYYDAHYEEAGASVVDAAHAWAADMVVCLDAPSLEQVAQMASGATLLSRLDPQNNSELIAECVARNITAIALDAVPRISRAQSLDVRSSLMNVAGYRAVIEAASVFGRQFAGAVTAAGRVAPAKVYVIGVGVAGLAAIGTAGSMGAEVSATDVRADVADQVQSLGATFVEIPVQQESSDGYARELDEDDQARTQQVYAKQAAASDIVITTAQVPGRPAPLLLTAEAVSCMMPGSVIVDMGASDLGSNCALTKPGEVTVTENGVIIVGYTDLPGRLPGQASQLFGQNIVNLLKLVTSEKDGVPVWDEEDVVVRGMLAARDGNLMWPPPPVQVSAAPAPAKPAEAQAPGQAQTDAKAKAEGASTAEEVQEEPSRFRGLWWKALLGVLAVLLIVAAPASMSSHFIVFVLACVVGFYVITGVSHTLHTPLMSETNAISGIIVVGALLQIGSSDPLIVGLSFVAVALASINIFGGFLVTRRMLKMFERSSK
ncbi:Re/Si-specific NAD(P)(+) transhydrogenase subunit alpha [Anaerotardibacter muris]|uniref:Re/Si-specific NAD(P)(+) transhydrogenase subunit alpha n=1 Tax=Anaerotardibacter muris TaxID=2941505 RepID=UPI0020402C59|nr:Re/Si-specific NAD(P)(+) transhydrogenase subunit alpha [Anaerotardibacter muris]